MEATIEKSENKWLLAAVRELVEIQHRWTFKHGIDISSFRKMESVLGMNDRTLRKLSLDHPDDTLSLGSVINLYVRLFIVCKSHLNGREKSQEMLLLQNSFVKVYVCTGKIPPGLAERTAKGIGEAVNIA